MAADVIELRGCVVDLDRAAVCTGSDEVALTPLEVSLLRALAAGALLGRADAEALLYGSGPGGRGLDNVVARLRRKLPDGVLRTVRGQGWRLERVSGSTPPPPPEAAPLPAPRRRMRLAGGAVVDLEAGTVERAGRVVSLTGLERKALAWLADRAGQRVPREELLTEVWGWRPGLDTRAVERGLQRLRRKLDADPAEPLALRSERGAYRLVTVAGNVPADPRPLLGRDALLDALHVDVAGGARLLTLTGPGGVGKTRLATTLAVRLAGDGRFAGGAWLADLSVATSLDEVAGSVLAGVGLSATGVADAGAALLGAGARLRSRGPVLVVLDNCEHVLRHVPAAVARWLVEAPDLVVVATSRAPLDLGAEQVREVPPLATADAVALLEARARVRTSDRAALADIASGLDHLPLALELAAARLSVLSPRELLDRLDRPLDSLGRGPVDAPVRAATLRGALAWSWELLGRDDRDALAHAAVFRGPFDRATLAEVLGADPLDAIGRLVAASLVHPVAEDGPVRRFRLLGLVRAYALERLGDRLGTARAAHRRALARRGWAAHEALAHDAAPAPSTAWLETAVPDLLEAHAHALGTDADDAVRLALAAATARILPAHAVALVRAALQAGPSPALRARGERVLGDGLTVLGLDGRPMLEAAVRSARRAGSPWDEGMALRSLAAVAIRQRDGRDVRPLLAEAEAVARAADLPTVVAEVGLTRYVLLKGDGVGDPDAVIRDAVAAAERSGSARTLSRVLRTFTGALEQGGLHREARAAGERALALAHAAGDRSGIVDADATLAWILVAEGRPDEGLAGIQRAVAWHRERGEPEWLAWQLHHLGLAALDRGHPEEAIAVWTECVDLYARLGIAPSEAVSARSIGLAWQLRDDPAEAERGYRRSLELLAPTGQRLYEVASLALLATARAEQGAVGEADALLRRLEPEVGAVVTLRWIWDLCRAHVDLLTHGHGPELEPASFVEVFTRCVCRSYRRRLNRG